MNTNHDKSDPTPSDPSAGFAQGPDNYLPDLPPLEDYSWDAHVVCIWSSQENFLKMRFGEKLDWAKYGWGSCYANGGAAESTKICAAGKAYILSSWSSSDSPTVVTHDLYEL